VDISLLKNENEIDLEKIKKLREEFVKRAFYSERCNLEFPRS
jgi:hypothetical protein